MAKIPFDIKYMPLIESGEYKVETRDGRIVHNIWQIKEPSYTNNRKMEVCALIDGEEDALVFFEGGRYRPTTQDTDSPFDLFIITPEPELSEFEKRIFMLLRQYKECDIPLTPENIKAEASMLWPELEKYFFDLYGKDGEGDSALRSFYYRGLADGKAEALKDLPRWRKYNTPGASKGELSLMLYSGVYEVSDLFIDKGLYIPISDLEKLPKDE